MFVEVAADVAGWLSVDRPKGKITTLKKRSLALQGMFQIDYCLHNSLKDSGGIFSFISCLHLRQKLMSVLASGSMFSLVDCFGSGVLEASKHNTS